MRITFLLFLVFVGTAAFAAESIHISSPDQQIQLQVSRAADGTVNYALSFNRSVVILPSSLGFSLSKPLQVLNRFDILSIDSSKVDETWEPLWGEQKTIRNNYRQLRLTLKENTGSGILLILIFRVFNDGLGFRYEFPKQQKLDHFIIAGELTGFTLSGDHKAFWIPGDYDTNENVYTTSTLAEVGTGAAIDDPSIGVKSMVSRTMVQTPLMMKTTEGLYINIHEAALVNYPAMQLDIDKKDFSLHAHLVPDAIRNKAYLQTPAVTPWRTIIVSDKAADILSSRLILNLNEPSAIGDHSFIHPQKMVGVWWEMHVNKTTWDFASGRHGAHTANVKRYIDFAAAHKINGVLVEGWNEGWEDWYGNWKENVFDFITPYPDYDIDEVTSYAASKGVKVIMHHETSGSVTNYERYMDTAFRYMLNHHMNTVKTGYVGRIIPRGEHHDGQWMVNHYNRVASKAASYGIMIDAHEPVRPTGLHRTYPNWLTCEAARGNEFNAWSEGNPPEHETILPFTRLMGGPMDYTPGIFRIRLNQYDSSRKFQVHTTLAKQLALYVTIYSPLQMAADLPENYALHPDAFTFIEDVPVDWDDTRILEAEPGDYVTIARKAKGRNDWFVGSITDENARESVIKCDFLDEGKKYEAVIYRDAPDAHWKNNPEAYVIEKKMIHKKSILKINVAAGGGYAISIYAK